ncbi:MAG: DUF1697 domain-containing protein [Aeromicrobium sp.]
MSTRVILLRAVNVGGASLPMAGLRALLTELGARDVRTYIQSGNAVCVPPGDPADFDRAIEKAIEAEFGFFREAISRSPEELNAALEVHPFDVIEPRYSYIAFMTEPPAAEAVAKARTYETGDDRWDVIGREWHIRYAHGAGRPEMKAAPIGRVLKVTATARNLNTVRKLIDLAAD